MSEPAVPLAGIAALAGGAELAGDALKTCCATAYADPAVRWLLGEELHPGGARTTRRALELAGLRPGLRLLDVASGAGASARLAAGDLGAEVVGVEYGAEAVRAARESAAEAGLDARAEFVRGDAEALPFADGSFDVVLCECSLCTFPDKRRAAAELARVLRPGGRLALSDVVVEAALPPELGGALATVACVGGALSLAGYEELLGAAGLTISTRELCREDADLFARGIEERLRGARLLGIAPPEGAPIGVEEAIAAMRLARRAIAAGTLGYAILVGEA
jgi:hypothetical protein